MILAAQHIRSLCGSDDGLIAPFVERSVDDVTGMSYGLSCAGYDVRLDQKLCIGPGDFVLASTMERLVIPKNIIVYVKDKSSLARRGVSVLNTCLEPGWCGFVTLEIKNNGWEKINLPSGGPIAQFIFHELKEATSQPYCGKYQDQKRGPIPSLREVAL